MRVLIQLSKDELQRYPKAAKKVLENMHVDDALFGADTMDEAIVLAKSLTELLKAGGFPLRKWLANHPNLLSHVPQNWLAKDTQLPQLLGDEHKLLGLF